MRRQSIADHFSGICQVAPILIIIMTWNSVVCGLHNPVCLWIVGLYNVVSPRTISPYLKICLLRFGTFRKRYASREVRANFRPSHLPFGDVTHNLSAFAPSRLLPRPQSFPISYPCRTMSGIINEWEWHLPIRARHTSKRLAKADTRHLPIRARHTSKR